MAEKFFWADAMADRIVKEKGKKKEYVCASGITPSGHVHIGNFREVITTEMVVKALRDKGHKARFIYSWDDYDRFRKVPKGISQDFEKYLGMPISDIPSPYNKKVHWAEYFEKEFEKSLKIVGIKPIFIYQNKMNKQSKYSRLVKKSIDERKKVMSILNKYRKEPLAGDWYPVIVYCEKCKKDSTKVLNFKGWQLTYECSCGERDTFDIRKKGLISVKWRIDWPMRWKYEGVDFEPGGNDHSVHGGSYTTGKEISKKIFDFEPPLYQFYDWVFLKGGGAFSSSSGNALTLKEVSEIYEPEVLRYLFVSAKPKSEFRISFDNDILKIYDEFDRLERRYFEGTLNGKEKRVYEFSVIEMPKTLPKRSGFRHLSTLIQTNGLGKLNQFDKARIERVKNWLEKYAGEDMKFKVRDQVYLGEFNKDEIEVLRSFREFLKGTKSHDDKELLDGFYEICEELKIDNFDFFEIIYRALIGKLKGPRLAGLIKNIGIKKVIKMLDVIK